MRKTVLCFTLLLAVAAIEASAWEKDLHYGLTKWLAFQAGFSLQDSETIALGTEAPDEGKLYPAVGAVWQAACISHNTDLSRLVQQFHYPGYGPVPGSPNLRTVDPALHDNLANAPRDAIILTVGQDARQHLLVKRMAWATM